MLADIKEKVNTLETLSLNKILATFFCIIVIRIFLDSFAYTVTNGYVISWEHSLQALLYFFSIFLSFSILLFLLTRENYKSILSFLSKVSTTILLVPIVDLLINQQPISFSYVTIVNNDFLKVFFQLMNPFNQLGVTTGLYVAAYLTLALFSVFVYKKTHSFVRAFSVIFLGYLVFFVYSILPSIFLLSNQAITSREQASLAYYFILKESWLGKNLGLPFSNMIDFSLSLNSLYELVMASLFWILSIVQASVILFLCNNKLWKVLRSNLRLERVFNYSLIAVVGMVISGKIFGSITVNPINIIILICFFILLSLNAWFASFINDVEDIEIDMVSNPGRPLVAQSVPKEELVLLYAYIFIFMILGFFLLNQQVAFLIILAQCGFYVYSAKPLRLKRNFIFSSLLVGFTTIVIAMAGFFLVSPDAHLNAFPLKAIFIIGFAYALLSNIKDVKDYEGDSTENIRTMPVVFGLTKSKIIIALLYTLVFLSLPFLLSIAALLPFAILASFFVFYLLIKKDYQEKYVFYTKFAYMIVLYFLSR